MTEKGFVELCARSNFSFLRGGSPAEVVVECAKMGGYDALGIADCDGLYGQVRAMEAGRTHGIRPIVGAEITLGAEPPFGSLVLHVVSAAGYTNLCRILTEAHRFWPKGKARKKSEKAPRNANASTSLRPLAEHAEGLFATLLDLPDESALPPLRDAFGERLSLGVWRWFDGGDRLREETAARRGRVYNVPLLATNRVLFARVADKAVFDVLHCIREGITLDEAGRGLLANAEPHLKGRGAMEALFADAPERIVRTREVASACLFAMSELRYRFPYELDDPAFVGETSDQALRRLTYAGANDRYPGGTPPNVIAQIEKELALIAKLDVAPYFLSVAAIVQMARKRDILCQGRGSAANSAVCFCLKITAVDPARSSMLFERFLSAERNEPPDIDIDFEHERREEIIQAVYEKYGRERAAMVSNVVSYRGRSALREVSKVFGLSLEESERLSAVVSFFDPVSGIDRERLKNAGFDPDDKRLKFVVGMSQKIQHFPRHLSIHPGGFVLSASPLHHVAPIEPATMPGRTVIPWDKDDLDTLGFFKVDILALGILSAVRRAMDLVKSYDSFFRGETVTDRLAEIPPEDPLVYDALCKADTVGVFQIESRAQMAMLPRLRPRTFYDLVIEVAIVRPGPIQGGMVHPYLRRRAGEEPVDVPHESLMPILKRTLGVPIFQEQVMQIAITAAGYKAGEADELRRDMSSWRRRGKLDLHYERLRKGFRERGIADAFGEQLFKQIAGFAEYGFPESHAASFALLVYASAWLKTHHPAAFAAALLNSQPMGFYSPNSIVADAKRHSVEVRPICVVHSSWDCTLEMSRGVPALRLGLRQIKGQSEEIALRVLAAREAAPFRSTEDLLARASLSERELQRFAQAGALREFSPDRRQAIWSAVAPKAEGLFRGVKGDEALPELPPPSPERELVADYAATGLSLRGHPMELLRPRLPKGILDSKQLAQSPNGSVQQIAGMVTCRQRPGTASGVVFITLEDEHGFMNAVLYAPIFEKFRRVATTSALLSVTGIVQNVSGTTHLVAQKLIPLSDGEQLRFLSRDFH